jgi:predicted dehydrogenase
MPDSAPAVALIGVTGYAALHLDHLLRLHADGRIRLAAATVVNPGQAATQLARLAAIGAEIHGDHRAMLAAWRGRLGLCAIPTAISLHRPMVEDALAAGAHVLVEKPLAGCLADAEAVVAAAAAAGRSVLVGFQDAWDPATAAVRSAIAADAVGRLRAVLVDGSWPRGERYYTRNAWVGRRRDAHGAVNDSPAANAFAHFLQLAFAFAGGGPREVAGSLLRANQIETFDTALIRIGTTAGVPIRAALTHADAEVREPSITALGERGRLTWRFGSAVELRDGTGLRTIATPDSDEGRRRMFAAAADLAAGRACAAACTAADALAHAHLIDLLAALPVAAVESVVHPLADGDRQRVVPGLAARCAAWMHEQDA